MIRYHALLPVLAAVLVASALLPVPVQARELASRDIVFLVRVGTRPDNTPVMRIATSNDPGVERLYRLAMSSPAVAKTARYYRSIQEAVNKDWNSRARQSGFGFQQSSSTDPVFIEVPNDDSGAYNNWDGTFYLRDGSGYQHRITSPRVVLPVRNSLVSSSSQDLLEQTLVHEMGHSMMSKGYGLRNLPESEHLHDAHSGGSVTDEQLAIIEGYAEFIGAYFTNRLTIANDAPNAIPDNLYSYDSQGRPKSAADLMKTEGWVATVLWHLAARSGIDRALDKMSGTMIRHKPHSIGELFEAFARDYPSDADRMRSIVERTSHGAIYGYDSSIARGGSQGGSSGSPSRLASLYTHALDRYMKLRYASLVGARYYPGELARIRQALYFQTQRIDQIEQQLMVSGDPSALRALSQRAEEYDRLYQQSYRQLMRLPWYSRAERERLSAEAAVYGEALSRVGRVHGRMAGMASSSGRDSRGYLSSMTGGGQVYRSRWTGRGPAAPSTARKAAGEGYKKVLEAIKAGDREGAAKALRDYRSR